MTVDGVVAPGYEPVRQVFEDNIGAVGEGGAAFAAMHDGALVADLWTGSARPGEAWQSGTRGVLMSTTKGLAAVAFARLVERGLVDVEAPIREYWPEFATAGKQEATVAHLLSHTLGVLSVPGYQEFMTPEGDGWDRTDEILRRLTGAEPVWAPGTDVGYHALTWGWLVDELSRRVCGRTLGAILREEVAGPLGLELDLGTPPEARQRVAALIPEVPAPLPPEADAELTGQAILAVGGRNLVDAADVFFTGDRLGLELPACNATATARAVASVYGALAAGGRLAGVSILEPATIKLLATERIRGTDRVSGLPVRWALGVNRFIWPDGVPLRLPADESFGTGGAGGQIGFADPPARLGFGFVRSHLAGASPLGPLLVDAVYRCLVAG